MPTPPPSIDPSIKVIKTFTYRGAVKTYSNRYHFDNLKPTDNTHWTTLSDAIVAAEKATIHSTSGVTIVGTSGYDAGSEIPVFSKTYTTVGTATFTSAGIVAGDSCALVRYSTAQRTTKNHPIYLFNYVHPAFNQGSIGDQLNPTQKTTLETYAAAWVAGFSDGTVTHHRCGPQGHVATGYRVDPWIRHRDFPAG